MSRDPGEINRRLSNRPQSTRKRALRAKSQKPVVLLTPHVIEANGCPRYVVVVVRFRNKTKQSTGPKEYKEGENHCVECILLLRVFCCYNTELFYLQNWHQE